MKILLPVDGSEASNAAIEFVRKLACTNPVDVVVLTVSYDPEQHSIQPWMPEWTEHERARTAAILDLANETLQQACQSVLLVHESGATVPVILGRATSTDVDLIVLGAKGHSTIHRVLLGSVSDSIATRAECSVVVVRPTEQTTGASEKVILGFDQSIASREAVSELMEWNLDRETDVNVLSVAQQPMLFVGDGYTGVLPVLSPEQMALVSETGERMASQIAEHFPHTTSKTIAASHVGEAIVQVADENQADLILVGDHGHSLIGQWILGSTSQFVLRHAACSVWISRHHWKSHSKKSQSYATAAVGQSG